MKPQKRDIEIYAQIESYGRDIGIAFTATDDKGNRVLAKELVFEPIDDGEYTVPTISVRKETAQHLMDGLWACGLRPTEGSGSAGSLAATEKHLKDMQSVAFGLLKRQGVER